MFADDVQIYHSFTEAEVADAVVKINEDIAAVCVWAKENKLLLNAKQLSFLIQQ